MVERVLWKFLTQQDRVPTKQVPGFFQVKLIFIMFDFESSKNAVRSVTNSSKMEIKVSLLSELKEQSEEMGPANIFQVTQVPPYGEVDNIVEAIPKRYKEKRGK